MSSKLFTIASHRTAVRLMVWCALLSVSAAAASSPLLLRKPTISRTQIAFSYGGDLWIVDRNGGEARRLTSDVGIETDPLFSPNGSLIAFTGEYDGNEDVYVIPVSGGIPKRLTTHPTRDQVVGWTRDGKRILFRSERNSWSRFNRLFTVSVEGGLPEEVPLPMAEEGSYSPDSSHLAYVPFTNFKELWERQRGLKHYRGGTASPIWIAKLSDSSVEKLPRKDSNDSTPMWFGNRIYFLSDRNGPVNLFWYDTNTKQVGEAINPDGADIKSASMGPDAIVYEQFGAIHLFDPATGTQHRVEISVAGDFPAVRPHFVKAAEQIQNANVSPTGARAVFEAHGEIFTVPAEHGDIRNLTNSPAVADRDPAWSPDGKWIAYFSDESGEYALHLRSQDGLSEIRRVNLGATPTFYYSPVWSPDSKKIAYSDKRLNLWYLDFEKGKPILVDTNVYESGPGSGFNPVWSPDGQWIAYTRQLTSGMRAVFICGIGGKPHQVTDGMSDAAFPAFDRNGRYLYFVASTDIGPVLASSMGSFRLPVTRNGYLIVLNKDLKSPLSPQSDEEKQDADKSISAGDKQNQSADVEECSVEAQVKGSEATDSGATSSEKEKDKASSTKVASAKKPPIVKIDFDNIDQRILALPFPARNYGGMIAGKTHILYLLESPALDDGSGDPRQTVHKFDLCTKKTDKLLDNIGNFFVTANAEKVLYEQLPEKKPEAARGDSERPHGVWFIKAVEILGKPPEPSKSAASAPEPSGQLKLDSMEVAVDPRAEWKQMYREVWRLERDFFYDPNLHGANLKMLIAAYEPYVDNVMSRADLNYIFADMLGDITAQHIYVAGGDRPEVKHVSGGLLGADYMIDHDRYRFWHIYRGENWNPDLRAPLTEPGVNVKEGEYLLGVDGRELRGSDELFSFFQETTGKSVQLKVGPDPTGKGARSVSVTPIANERSLRLRAWMEANRLKVDELSHGKLAYVYLPDTFVDGFTNFNRYYFAQSDRQGAVIDERYNGGGWVADYIVDWLKRPLLAAAMTREGRDNYIPQAIFGPKVMLINEYAGSGGDALPWMFRRLGTGPLIGTRTWGGLIGIGGYPTLMDGGTVTAPRWGIYNPESGEFDVENKGVSPDIEIELDPAAWRQGHDPQLEKAVSVALGELQQHPLPEIKRPKYPVYNWSSVRTGDSSTQKPGGQN